jgi:hypothetical protein
VLQVAEQVVDLVPIKHVAREWNVSVCTVRRMIAGGSVEHIRLGSGRGRLFLPPAEVQRVLRERYGPNVAHHRVCPPQHVAEQTAQRMALINHWFTEYQTTDPADVLQNIGRRVTDIMLDNPGMTVQQAFTIFMEQETRAVFGDNDAGPCGGAGD